MAVPSNFFLEPPVLILVHKEGYQKGFSPACVFIADQQPVGSFLPLFTDPFLADDFIGDYLAELKLETAYEKLEIATANELVNLLLTTKASGIPKVGTDVGRMGGGEKRKGLFSSPQRLIDDLDSRKRAE